jgi:hypothetical protein
MRTMPGRGAGRLSLAWGALLTHLPNEHSHIGLTRFMGYCSREGIAPNDVDPKTFINFRDALLTTSLLAKPEAVFRTTVRLWNRFASSVAGWPREIIPLATSEQVYSLTWDRFPTSFVADVHASLAHSGNQDPLVEDYAPSVKANTTAMRRKQILQLASALVASGEGADSVTTLAVLV